MRARQADKPRDLLMQEIARARCWWWAGHSNEQVLKKNQLTRWNVFPKHFHKR